MKIINPAIQIVLSYTCLALISCAKPSFPPDAVNTFINNVATRHQFNTAELNSLFSAVELKEDIIKKISKPAEGLPWYKYRKIFITDERINGGVKFWQDNEKTLKTVEQQYGVPAEIIIAILGAETQYGKHTGKYRVIDALSTLAFHYPKRSQFFLGELEHFLLLCKKEHINPLEPTGSYAGAMGMPQFMPSSFNAYAIDFNNNNKADIWHDPQDAIASVANYFSKHHWQSHQIIAVPAQAKDMQYKNVLNDDLKPNLRLSELESVNVTTMRPIPLDSKVKLLAFEQLQGDDLWAGLDNFYVITRYNHSPLYAMAVYQLSQSILNKKGSFP